MTDQPSAVKLEQDLRETSDTLVAALDQLAELEQRKRSLAPDDPGIVDLSTRIEEIAEQVLGASAAQRQLTEVGRDLTGAPDIAGPTRSIEDTPRSASVVLQEWRDVERRAAEAPTGSREQIMLRMEADALRSEYRLAFQRATGKLD